LAAGFATLAMLLLISLALNAIFLGIIGEYLARIYRQVKPGPLTIVERFIDRTEPAGSDPPGGRRGRSPASCCPMSKWNGAVDPKARPMEFDRYAEDYQCEVTGPPSFGRAPGAEKARLVLAVLAAELGDPKRLRVLDVGCGIGLVDQELARGVGELCGADVSLQVP